MKQSALERRRKSEAVRAQFLQTVERRTRLAADFKAKLLAALPSESPGAAVDALVLSAVSAFVEVSEVSAQFFANRTKPYSVRQLTVARSELRRCLQALNLIEAVREEPTVPSVQQLIARFDKPAPNGGAA